MPCRLFTSLLLLTMVSGFHTAQGQFSPMEDVTGFRKGLQEMAQTTESIQADFKQEKYLSILSNRIQSEGSIHFKKPNLLSWEYTRPFRYQIILDGKQIIVNDQGNVNAFDISASKSFKQLNELIIKSVQGNVLDETQFHIQYLESKDRYLTKLTPKNGQLKEILQAIDLYFDKQDYSVTRIRLMENKEDYTLISFFNKKMNEPIPDEKFTVQ